MSSFEAGFHINEVVNYLIERKSAAIQKLEKEFPMFSELLQPGMTMGSGDEDQSAKSVFVANLLVAALTEAQGDADQKLVLALRAIRLANTFKTCTQYLALLMSGSTLTLIGFEKPIAAQITSVAALLGSLLGLASERILAVVDPTSGSYRSIYVKLVGLAEKARTLRREALVHVQFPGSDEVLVSLSGQANAVCLQIRELGAQL